MSAEPALANESIYRATPLIEVNGERDAMIQRLLISMEMNENEGGLSALELRFINTARMEQSGVDYAFEFSDQDLLSLGNSIKVFAGDENDPQEIFRGVITALELNICEDQQPQLVVLAEDTLQKARMQRVTHLYTDIAVRDIVEEIAQQLGMRTVISGLQQTVEAEMQLNESHLAFLRRLLQRYDADLQIVEDELHVSPRSDVRRNEISVELNSQLRRLKAIADLSRQVSQVTFSGWDVSQGQNISVSRDSALDAGPGTGTTGAEMLANTIGERSEHITNVAARNEAEAQALVDARFSQSARLFVCVDAIVEGNPAIRVGTHVTLQGVGPRFENTYYVKGACHRYDLAQGYQTEFKAETGHFGG